MYARQVWDDFAVSYFFLPYSETEGKTWELPTKEVCSFSLTRELRMRIMSYRELWESVSLDRSMGCKHYANEVRSRLTFKLLSIFN